MRFIMLSAFALMAACAPPSENQATNPGNETLIAPDRVEILQTVDNLFLALGAADADTFAALMASHGIVVIVNPDADDKVTMRPSMDLVEDLRAVDFPKIRERYWDPIVLQQGRLAVVWAPYYVDVNDQRLHCGIDVFNMTKPNDAWLIDSIHYTAEPRSCDVINPGAASVVRPDFSALDAKEE